jgi:hypothetical protein
VTPRVVRPVVGAADGSAHLPAGARHAARLGTAVTARDTPRRAGGQLRQARLSLLAPDTAARRHI